MIVVLGRPGLDAEEEIGGRAGRIAVAAAKAGGRVELVGSVGDDADGDTVMTELGRSGIGHAAVLRDPAGQTRRDDNSDTEPLPRLDAADIDLGLSYLAECQVLVVAEPLAADALRVASDAATYHSAALVVLAETGMVPSAELPESATVLEVPEEDSGAFPELVGRYAALLDSGRAPADAWRDALDETGWEQAAE